MLPLSRRKMRFVLGTFWLIAAALQAQTHCFTSDWWRIDLAKSAMAEPASIRHSILWAVSIVAGHPGIWNSLFVAVQAALGVALVLGRFERTAILASVPWALGIWWVGEGFGMLPTGFALFPAGSPGPAVLYPLIGYLAWPTSEGGRSSSERPVTTRSAMVLWVFLWCAQALLLVPWRFPSGQVLGANIEELSAGPAWMLAITGRAGQFAASHGPVIAWSAAVASVLVGVSVFNARSRARGLAAGIVALIIFWIIFQGAGGLVTGEATDVGTAPLVILLALGLWRAKSEILDRSPQRESRRRLTTAAGASASPAASNWVSTLTSEIPSALAAAAHAAS